jgi:hypothetical protein
MLADGKAKAAATYRWIDCRRLNAETGYLLRVIICLTPVASTRPLIFGKPVAV